MRKLKVADWLTPLFHSPLLACRQGGFHFWDFLLGVLFTTAVMGFLYYRVRNTGLKALNRERQSFAVRVRTAQIIARLQQQAPTSGGLAYAHCACDAGAERHGLQYLEEGFGPGVSSSLHAEPSTMLAVFLGQTHTWCVPKHCFGFQVNLPSWVNFPDFERVGWLNNVMSKH